MRRNEEQNGPIQRILRNMMGHPLPKKSKSSSGTGTSVQGHIQSSGGRERERCSAGGLKNCGELEKREKRRGSAGIRGGRPFWGG